MSVNMTTNAITTGAVNIITARTVTITHINITEDSIEAVQGHQASSADSTKETKAEAVSVVIHETGLTDPVHQADSVTEIDAHVGAINILVLIHPCATCHALDVEARNILWRTANARPHWNKSRQI